MKLSKPLLQAIALGLAVGTVTPACSLIENTNDVRPHEEKASEGKGETQECIYTDYDCPACGMG